MTREHYLEILGLHTNATWEEVQSAYARVLERHFAAETEDEESSENKEELAQIEEAYSFLVQDPVIQARRRVPATTANKPYKSAHPIPVANVVAEGSDWNTLLCVLVCSILLLVGAFTFINRNLEARQVSNKTAQSAQMARTLHAVQKQNELLAQQIDLLDVELARLQRRVSANDEQLSVSKQNRPSPSSRTSTPPSKDLVLPIDDSQLPVVGRENFEQLINLPPSAFTERDKMYVIQSDGNLVEGYISITPALIDASIRCDIAQAKALLSDGLDVNQLDQRGDSALAWAVKRNCTPIVRLLLRHGVEVDSASENGFTPYLWARLYNNQHMMQLLKRAGADTKRGGYWWREREDGKKEYIERSLAAACRDPLALGCQN